MIEVLWVAFDQLVEGRRFLAVEGVDVHEVDINTKSSVSQHTT